MTPYLEGVKTGLFIAATIWLTVVFLRKPRERAQIRKETRGEQFTRFGQAILYFSLMAHPIARMFVQHHVFRLGSETMWSIKEVLLGISAGLFIYGWSLRRRELTASSSE